MKLPKQKKVLFLPILLLALAVRLWGINARSLWFDESVEYWSSIVGFEHLPATILANFQPPLYNFILHFWLKFASGPTWIRSLSVAFSLLGLLGVMILAYQLFGLKGALLSGLLLALMPTDVKYAQEAAEYALMSFALSWSLLTLYYAHKTASWLAWGLWGLLSVISVYSHYGASLTIFAVSGLVFIENLIRRRSAQLVKQAAVAILGLLLCVPLLSFLPEQLLAQRQNIAVAGFSLLTEAPKFVQAVGKAFLFPLTGDPYSSIPAWLPRLCIYGVLCLSFILLTGQNEDQKRLFAWFWGAFLAYYGAVRASWYGYGNFGFRYMLILSPLFVLIIAAVVLRLWESRYLAARLTAATLLLLIIGIAAYSLPNRPLSSLTRGDTEWPETEDMSRVIGYWSQHASHDTPTYIYYGANPSFRYYARFYDIEQPTRLPPAWYGACWQGLPVEYCRVDNVYYGAWLRSLPADDKISSIQKTLGGLPDRFWIIFSHIEADEDQAILQKLLGEYTIEAEQQLADTAAYLLAK